MSCGFALWNDFLPRVEEWTGREDNGFVALKTLGNGHSAVCHRADLDVATLDLVLSVDDIDIVALLIAQNGTLGQGRRGGLSSSDFEPRRSRRA